MEGSSSIQMRIHSPKLSMRGYALVDIVLELAVSAGRAAARLAAQAIAHQRQVRARNELQNLSDHFLRDIGIDRSDIDRMFR